MLTPVLSAMKGAESRSCSCRRGSDLVRLRGGARDCLLGGLRAKRRALHPDHFDISHSEKAKHTAQPRHLEIEGCVCAGVDAAARAHDDDALARHESLRTLFAVTKCTPCTRDVIEPRLDRK